MNKNFLIISIGRGIQILLSIVILRVSTNFLKSSEMGVFYLLISLLSYFSMTLIGPVGNFINRKVHYWKENGELLQSFIKYNFFVLLVSIISIPIVYILTKNLGVLANIDTLHLTLIVSTGIYFTTLNTFFSPTLNLLNHRIAFVIFSNLTLLGNILFSILFVNIFEASGFWWFAGQILSQILFTILSGLYFFSKIDEKKSFNLKGKIKSKDFKSVLSFSIPLAIATFFMWTTNESYRFIIERYLSLEYLGLIAIGIAISTKIATAVETLIHQLFHPQFFKAINTSDSLERSKAWNNFFKISLPAYISVTLFMSCMSPFLLRILASKEYYDAWIFLVFGAFLNLSRMVTNHVALIAHSEFSTKHLILPNILSATTSVILVYISVNKGNYYLMVPSSLLVGSLVGMLVMIFQMNKILKINFNFKDIVVSTLLGVVYLIGSYFYKSSDSLITSLSVVAIFGTYFVITQYLFLKRNNSLNF